ncbi:MAG: hypothetical protein KL801_09780 [Mesorhizobium sp.]|nr:hypothetical protein [Mesorhizobium sp.]
MTTDEPLSEKGRDLKVRCKSMAFYEVRFRLRTHEKEGPKAALLQFLDADGRPLAEEHVSGGFSEAVGRYSYLKANSQTGVGVVRFFAPTSGGRMTLRFRTWANRHPVFLGRDISVRELAGWTIAAEPDNQEPVRLTTVARPLSIPVPAGAKVWLDLTLRSEADGDKIVLHAPCSIRMKGDLLTLGEASSGGESLRPFAGRGARIVLPVENTGETPVVLSLACEGTAVVDISDVAILDDATGAGEGAPDKKEPARSLAGAPLNAVSSSGIGKGERVRWAAKVGNRLFLRSTIIDTRQELTRTADKVSQIERTLEESLLLVEKKVDYLLAKIDAYAEVDDRSSAALHQGLATVRQNQAELRSWQEGVDGRLASIERGNADLAGEVSAVRQQGEAIKSGQQATDARLKDVEQASSKISEAVTANQTEFLKRQDGLDVRLASIEKSGAKLASALDASDRHVKQALKDIGGRTKKLEEMDKRLTRLAEPKKPEPAPIEPAERGKPTVLVELLGPSGVGKSTILRAAQALRTPEQWWWGADEIDSTIQAGDMVRPSNRDAVDNFYPPDFVSRCLETVTTSRMLPSQMVTAATQLRTTCQVATAVRTISSRHQLVHDELMLHRASTVLLYSDKFEKEAAWYFDTVPVPTAAIVLLTESETIFQRVLRRSEQRINTYYNLDENGLRAIIERSLRLAQIAAERLRARDVTILEIDAGQEVSDTAHMVHDFISSQHAKARPSRLKSSQ